MPLHEGKITKYKIFKDGPEGTWHVHGPTIWCGGYDTHSEAVLVFNTLIGRLEIENA